jgi:hypothetical protein
LRGCLSPSLPLISRYRMVPSMCMMALYYLAHLIQSSLHPST